MRHDRARVGRPLTLVASDTRVRICQTQTQVADHVRSWDRGRLVSDPEHEEALLQEKRRVLGSTAGGRLAAAVAKAKCFWKPRRVRRSAGPTWKSSITLSARPVSPPAGHSAEFFLQRLMIGIRDVPSRQGTPIEVDCFRQFPSSFKGISQQQIGVH